MELIALSTLIDDAKCYEVVRAQRWPEGVRCVGCDSGAVIRQGRDTSEPERQKYQCKACGRYFDDLTGTIFAGHHRPLQTWIGCLYLMGLNLSNRQIARELDLNKDDVQRMTEQLRAGVVARDEVPELSGTVECDEVYVVAGHKGQPDAVRKKAEAGDVDG